MELALLQSRDELDRVAPAIRSLAADTVHGQDTTGLPDYFLPRVSDTRRPRVVVCYEQGHLVGVVYTEELLFAGKSTGWVFGGDRMGRGLVLAAPEREAEVIATACEYLLANGVHALRLWWRSTGNEVLPVLQLQRPGLQVWCKSEIRPQGDWLHLETSYDSFLNALGPHTRRNLRYYRRRAEEEGYRFVPELSLAAYESAVHLLNQHIDSPETREHEQRDHRFFAQFQNQFRNQFGSQFGPPVLAGLAAPDGRLVSVLAGVRAGNHLHLLSQFNDESLHAVSPSLVLRGYLIEHLIAQGVASIHFVNGTSGPLARFCDPVLMRTISVDSRRSALHPVKLATATAARGWQRRGRWVPVRLRGLLGSYMAAV
jgi:hypothetical protein